jgi:hypothetical protein
VLSLRVLFCRISAQSLRISSMSYTAM